MITVTPASPPPDRQSLWNGGVFYRENFPRDQASSASLASFASGSMIIIGVHAYAGDLVTSINWVWGTTGAATPTNWWAAFYNTSPTPALIGNSADQLTTVITASAPASLALAGGPFPLTASGIYYVGLMVAGGTPTAQGKTIPGAPAMINPLTGQQKISGSGATGLSTIATVPATLATFTRNQTTCPYVALG